MKKAGIVSEARLDTGKGERRQPEHRPGRGCIPGGSTGEGVPAGSNARVPATLLAQGHTRPRQASGLRRGAWSVEEERSRLRGEERGGSGEEGRETRAG